MKGISVKFLYDEVLRLGSVIVLTRLLHPSSVRLHGPGDILTLPHVKLMGELGMEELFLLDPGEGEPAAQKALATQRIPRTDVVAGDVLAEDLRGGDGSLVAAAGAAVDPATLKRWNGGRDETVAILKRELDAMGRPAQDYLSKRPPLKARAKLPDERLTTITRLTSFQVRPFLMPRATVMVSVSNEFARSLIVNTLAAEGHEVTVPGPPAEAAAKAVMKRPDVLVIDVADAAMVGPVLRASDDTRSVSLLVCAAEGRAADVQAALEAGANEWIPLPPRPNALLEKVRGCMQVVGRGVNLKAAVQEERRQATRGAGDFVIGLADKFISKPIPVSKASVKDMSEGGLGIEYPAPLGSPAHAYAPHAVHPKHIFYKYSVGNPMGRDLSVSIPAADGRLREVFARFVHIARRKDYEVAGLAIQRASTSVVERLSAGEPEGDPAGR